jgi:hypothetical protein
MESKGRLLLIVIGLCLTVSLWAQSSKTKEEQEKEKNKFPGYAVFLGNSGISGGTLALPKRVFDSLIKQGLTAKDSMGNPFKFYGFVFTYGERNLYEDSVGNLLVLTDNLMEYCQGNTLSENIASSLFQRTKRGDTAYIDEITLLDTKGRSRKGRPMRIVLE